MSTNAPQIKQFIEENSSLFWYTPESEKENISNELLVETILNYGDLNTVKKLIITLGIQTTANVFFSMQGRKKMNFYPEIYNFFSLYFKRYA